MKEKRNTYQAAVVVYQISTQRRRGYPLLTKERVTGRGQENITRVETNVREKPDRVYSP